ncbi:caspase-3-like [Physella acuta]|uniref:caspase-3-like n=1 Tax=Physella acuta TaxID=109671 RepID=UPI0027DE4C5F|nr:caspase-3-like [Physella acuta]
MEKEHKDLLRRNFMQLAEDMKNGITFICKDLKNQKIIAPHMEERIIENPTTNREKAMLLLELLPSRGPHAFDALYNAAVRYELIETANILKPKQHFQQPATLPVQQAVPLDEDELPDTWPSEQDLNKHDVRLIEASDHHLISQHKNSLTPRGQTHFYTMKCKTRGLVLVINNENFDKLEDREGTLADRRSIETVFRKLGFEVEVHGNKKCEEMTDVLQEAARRDYSSLDCFILFILTHGEDGVVFGVDGYVKDDKPINAVPIKDIRNWFRGSMSLRGKPKIFFIQACRGKTPDAGVSLSSAESDRNLAKDTIESFKPQNAADASGGKIASDADFFIAMATTAGNLSWRNKKFGTWFVQAVVYIFAKYAYKNDLNKLMTQVNNLVGRAETLKGQYKQVAEKTDTFLKTCYFFPGLYLDKT